ncbi:NFACT-R_1 domain-containing protein, partial [Haematococcus lacustris]
MEIQRELVPSKLEQLVMADKTSVSLRLRSLRSPGTWLTLSWHHQAGRVCLAAAGPLRTGAASEVYGLQEQLSSKLQGLVLLE